MSGPPRKKVRHAMNDGPDILSKPILVRVGKEMKDFYIHETFLRKNSGFFDTTLKKKWEEGQDREVKLPETKVEAFEIWIKWLYTGRVFVTHEGDVCTTGLGSDESLRWESCYALGDFLQDIDFKDACIDTCIEGICHVEVIPAYLPEWIYQYSMPTSTHRRFAVDTFVCCLDRAAWMDFAPYPAVFYKDVLRLIGPNLEVGIKHVSLRQHFNVNDSCKYHDHGSEKPCSKPKPAFRS